MPVLVRNGECRAATHTPTVRNVEDRHVAKGNNGNLLQHFVESELAVTLTDGMLEKRFYTVFTHGMAPFEPCEPLAPEEPPELRNLLKALPTLDASWAEESGIPVLKAYKRLQATEEHFPNSAEVVASVLGDKSILRGEICEQKAEFAEQLQQMWDMSTVNVRKGSWRDAVRHISAPDGQDAPWIFSMDPYRFKEREFLDIQDDGYLDQHDLITLKPVVSGHFNTGARGVACIFSYQMQPEEALAFENSVHELCKMLGEEVNFEVESTFLPTPSEGTCEHVAAMIAEDTTLLRNVKGRWAKCLDAIRAVI